MNNYLFLFTIGPVQSFIAQARKTQDLYAGSKLLSDLINVAIEFIGKEKIIFPNPSIEHKPNRCIAEVTSDNPMQLGKDTEEKVKSYLKEQANQIPKINGAIEQIENLLDIYWVMQERSESYFNDYKKIIRTLAAVKKFRTFSSFSETGRKCSLDGKYNVKYYRLSGNETEQTVLHSKGKLFQDSGQVAIIQKDEDKNISLSQLQPGEGLSAPSLIKRIYRKKEIDSFESTAGICLLDKLKNFRNPNNPNFICFDKYENLIKANVKYFDEQMYFEENATSEKYLMDLGILNEEMIKSIRDYYLKNIKERIENEKDKYYAIFSFDGDNMGKWMSGEYLKDKEKLKEFQIKLSELLGLFAKNAKAFLDDKSSHKGRTVYAGGDDFLAFINLNYLFETLKELRANFKKNVSDKLIEYNSKLAQEFNFSAGVTVAHYKIPLSEVLKQNRIDRDKAKEHGDGKKDAFCFSVLKHSGEKVEFDGRWFYDNESSMQLMKNLSRAWQQDQISTNFYRTLGMEFFRLIGRDKDYSENHIIEIEIKRLLERSIPKGVLKEDKKKNEIDTITKNLLKAYTSLCISNIDKFIRFLSVTDFISRHTNWEEKVGL